MMTPDIPDNAKMMALKREFEQWKTRVGGEGQ
jgi:hypothetical protein